MSMQSAHVSSSSVSNVGRDVLWERTVASLPPPLLEALRSSELDDPDTLVEYPRSTVEELERGLGRTLVGFDALAPWGAASTGQTTSTYGHGVPFQALEWPGVAATGLFGSGSAGGDPKTDHASSGVVDQLEMAATCPPYRPGWLATTTANFDPLSTVCTDSAVSRVEFQEPPDGFPSTDVACHERLDGFPSTAEGLDGLPSSADSKGREHPEGTNQDSTLDGKSTVFTRILHVAEESERLRQSDPGVQNMPASRSPSELSAHQMGLPLAGTVRLKSEPVSIDPMSTLAIGDLTQLSISDRALLRKYKSSGQAQELPRQAETYNDNTAAVRRVDGHSPELRISLYDRILLRKYSIPGTSVSPVVPLPIESTKKRRRFHQKGKLIEEATKEVSGHENCQDQEGSPCGFSSQVAEPPVRAATIISHSVPSPVLSHFTLLYYTLVWDGALPLGYLQEFISLEAPARRSANRLQASAVAVSDSAESMTLVALRRESEHRASVEKSIADQLVIAADMRPKRFRTKWQRIVYDGPTARKDAETAERDRWIQLLANLLRSTDTPMGKLIRENPSNIQLLGGGRRAGTLRSRVRSVQKFLGWLIASHGVSFPVHCN